MVKREKFDDTTKRYEFWHFGQQTVCAVDCADGFLVLYL
jgi:hypothetical protein